MNLLTAVRHLTKDTAIACEEMKDSESSGVLILTDDGYIKSGMIFLKKSRALKEIKRDSRGWTPTLDEIHSRTWTVIRYF